MNTEDERRSRLTARLEFIATVLLIIVALLVGGLTVWERMNPQPAEAARQAAPQPPPLPLPTNPVSIGDITECCGSAE